MKNKEKCVYGRAGELALSYAEGRTKVCGNDSAYKLVAFKPGSLKKMNPV